MLSFPPQLSVRARVYDQCSLHRVSCLTLSDLIYIFFIIDLMYPIKLATFEQLAWVVLCCILKIEQEENIF